MWTFLTGLLGFADPISKIARAIADSKIATANAQTDQERVASQERTRALELRRDVLIEESRHSNANVYVRIFLALPVGILLWKVLVYDKALGQWTAGVTDKLDANLWNVVMVVLGFYFLYEGAVGVARIFKR